MGIQAKKLLSRICRFMAFVALLLIMVAIGVGGNGEEQDPLLAHLMDSEEISQEMAELLQINCRNELLHAQKTLQDPELCSMMKGRFSHNVNVVKRKSSKTQMHDNTGNIWCPQVKQILLDCMVKKNPVLHIPAVERDLDTWYTRYLGSLHYASERRELGEKKKGKKAKKKEEDSSSSPIVAIAAASVTLAIAMVLFCFFCKCCMADSELNKNDESPLLTLSLSDKYVASQQKSLSRGTSMCEEKHETPLGITSMTSANSEEDPNQMPLVQPTSVQSGPLGAHGIAPLRPPPGRASTNLSMPLPVTASSPESSLPTQPGAPPNRTSSSGPLPLPPGALRPFQTPGAAELPAPPGAAELPAPPGSLGAPGLPPPPGEPGQPPPPGVPGLPPLPPGVPGQPLPPGVPGQPPPPLPPGAPGPPLPPGASGPPPPPGIVGGPPPPPPAGRGGGPPPPPPPGGRGGGPPPPPGLGGRGGGPPPPPGPGGPRAPPPLGKRPPRRGGSQDGDDDSSAASKAKLKPFFWDKVNANDNTMVWNQISAGSFQFNEEMMESLFGYSNVPKGNAGGKKESLAKENMPQFIQIIDPKKAQNLSIMLKALNVTTEEVCDALEEGNELPSELIQTLIKMAPTTEEELKLRIYNGDLALLGPAERFLKRLVDIPFPFKRLETLLFMCSLQEDMTSLKESFKVLEASCNELRKCRVFLKLLEAVLKTGNRMNDGTYRGGAQAFKLDTLLKLSDVKGVDGKTTLLHFVVLEIIRTEGIRSARASREMRSMSSFNSDDLLESPLQDSDELLKSLGLQIVSTVGDDLKNVKKAASMDADGLTGTVSRIGFSLKKAKDFLSSEMKSIDENNGFHQTLKSFVENASPDIQWALEEEKRIMAMVKSTTDFFHGSTGKDEGLRLFVIVRDFLIILDKICKELKSSQVMLNPAKKEQPAAKPQPQPQPQPPDPKTKTAVDPKPPSNLPPIPNQRMSAIINRRQDSSSSSSSDDD